MKRKTFAFVVLLWALTTGAHGLNAQQAETTFTTGLKLLGLSECKVIFVSGTYTDSPAAKAGLLPGDMLLEVNGQAVSEVPQAKSLLRSAHGKAVTLGLARGEKHFTAIVSAEPLATILARENEKVLDGSIYPLDATEAEIHYLEETQRALGGVADHKVIFVGHYPSNLNLYYGGFEVFVWDHDRRFTVGGMENGPAKQAGVRWGDEILAVDGVELRGKSATDVESLLSKSRPSSMQLTVERAGTRRTFTYELAPASQVKHLNNLRVTSGQPVPLWLPDEYLHCLQ